MSYNEEVYGVIGSTRSIPRSGSNPFNTDLRGNSLVDRKDLIVYTLRCINDIDAVSLRKP